MRWLLTLALVLAACGSSGPALTHLALPAGYEEAGVEQGEPAAFGRTYRAEVGAEDVALHRVDTPGGGPPLAVVSLQWAHPMDDRVSTLATELHDDVPIEGGRPTTVAGHPAVVREADDTLQSVVLVVDGRRGVLVYGGRIHDERNVARSVLAGW